MRRIRFREIARIISDTAVYRLKKREMGNLFTSVTLAAAIGLPARDVVHRLLFGFVLNVFVYLVNDCFDTDIDARALGRDSARTRFLAEHRMSGIAGAIALGMLCAVLGAAHGLGLLFVFALNVVVIVSYSAWLKRRPIVDLIAIAGWGASMALVGAPLDHPIALRLVGVLVCLCIVTQGIQVIRDVETDRAGGICTTAVVFGVRHTARISRIAIVAAAVYTTLFVHQYIGPFLLSALLPPIREDAVSRTWDLFRILFGAIWVALLIFVYATGHLLPIC